MAFESQINARVGFGVLFARIQKMGKAFDKDCDGQCLILTDGFRDG